MLNFSIQQNERLGTVVYGMRVQSEDKNLNYYYPYISPFQTNVENLIVRMRCAEALSRDHIDDIVSDELYRLYCEQLQLNNLAAPY